MHAHQHTYFRLKTKKEKKTKTNREICLHVMLGYYISIIWLECNASIGWWIYGILMDRKSEKIDENRKMNILWAESYFPRNSSFLDCVSAYFHHPLARIMCMI